MTIKINNKTPSISQYINKKPEEAKKKPIVSISNIKQKKSYTSDQTQPIKATNLTTLSYSAVVESEIKNQQAFSTYSQLIKKTKLNRFKTRFDLFL